MKRIKYIIFTIIILFIQGCSFYAPDEKLQNRFVLKADIEKLSKDADSNQAMEMTVIIIKNRMDISGVRNFTVKKQGEDKIVVESSAVKDINMLKNIITVTGKLEFKLVDENAEFNKTLGGKIPTDDELLYDREDKPFIVKKEVLLTGDSLTNAQAKVSEDSSKSEPYVSIYFNDDGGAKFAKITEANIERRLAIILDDKIHIVPVIKAKISGKYCAIQGIKTMEEAQTLAIIFQNQSLT